MIFNLGQVENIFLEWMHLFKLIFVSISIQEQKIDKIFCICRLDNPEVDGSCLILAIGDIMAIKEDMAHYCTTLTS